MIGRAYSASFDNVTVSAVQDLFSLKAATGMAFVVTQIEIGCIGIVALQELRIRLRRSATITQGSGGSTPTPNPMLKADVASVTTVHANDTTQTTTTLTTLNAGAWQLANGSYLWVPVNERNAPIIVPADGFIVSLDTAPSSGTVMSGCIYFAELG